MTTGHGARWASLRLRSMAGMSALLSAAALALLLLSAAPAWAEQRVALVIGNGSYAHAPSLANPLNDAADIGAALERLGFEVTSIENADGETLRRGLHEFKRAASVSDVAVLFYAGHGIEVDRRNFLVPVDARLQSDDDVEFETVPLELVSRAVEGARELRLIILDACRDNPFAAAMQRAGATRSIGRGLARVEPSGDTLVAYAAKEGTVAADGAGRNSPYTEALLAHLEEPGLEVGWMFREVRDAVLASTGGRQEPFVYGSLSGKRVYLVAPPEPEPAPAPTTAEAQPAPAPAAGESEALRALAEREFWVSVKDSAYAADIEAYLERYPSGTYEILARNRLARLQAAPEETGAAEAGDAPAPDDAGVSARLEAARLEAEREFWASVKDSQNPDELQAYLDTYPEGAYAVLARARLDRFAGSPDNAEAAPQSTAAVATAAQDDPPTPQPSVPTPEAVEAALGLERAERRQIQLGLASLGYDPGPADGLIGLGTRGAIGRWQSSRGSEASGHLDAEAAKLLLAAGKEVARKQAAEEAARKRAAEEAARERAAMRPGRVFRDCAECPELVVVPAGSFTMGSPSSEEGRYDDEDPQHRVAIAAAFAVGKYEVTRGEFAQFVRATGHSTGNACRTYEHGKWEGRSGRGWEDPGFRQDGREPAVCVSWDDAKAYVRWLSRKTGERYRLLSEAEWEYAARAGTRTSRYWGDDVSAQCDHANGYDRTAAAELNFDWDSASCRDGSVHTARVGRYGENGFGLSDMLGNVWEWVEECWHGSYAGAPTDGRAWATGGICYWRVLRGGSWSGHPGNLRSANRYGDSAGDRNNSAGFRVSRTLTP